MSSKGIPEIAPRFPAPAPEALALIRERRSIRAFLREPVPDTLLEQLLQTARQAPSGGNLQPGRLIAVRGARRERLMAALLQDFAAQAPECEDYAYFPQPMPMQLRKRQVAAAQALYGALGVARDDRAGRDAQFARNYRFFDAPVALVVTIDSHFGPGGYMDLGMVLYGLQLAAAAHGLGCCAIGALASYPATVRRVLDLPETQHIVCGLALGWTDEAAPINQTQTTRAPLNEWFQTLE
jgi:nitroreductase